MPDAKLQRRRGRAHLQTCGCKRLGGMDRFTRECLAIEVDTSFTGRRVAAVLNLLVAMRTNLQTEQAMRLWRELRG